MRVLVPSGSPVSLGPPGVTGTGVGVQVTTASGSGPENGHVPVVRNFDISCKVFFIIILSSANIIFMECLVYVRFLGMIVCVCQFVGLCVIIVLIFLLTRVQFIIL